MFTDPPLARVGLSEGEAERRGIVPRVLKLPMNSVLRAQATDERQGFMKALIAESDDRILGFAMIGAEAGEVMAAVHTAMLAGLPYSSLADAAFAHPTMAEGLSMLFSSVPSRAAQQTKSQGENQRLLPMRNLWAALLVQNDLGADVIDHVAEPDRATFLSRSMQQPWN